MSQEQIDVYKVIESFREKGLSDEKVIDFLASTIKQQMMYGGTLQDKLNFWFDKMKHIKFIDKSQKI